MKSLSLSFISFGPSAIVDRTLTPSLSQLKASEFCNMFEANAGTSTSASTSSLWISDETIAATAAERTFEAVAPDTTTLVGFGVVLLLSIVASQVWANDVVPVSRTKLALSKRQGGEVNEYLSELKQGSLENARNELEERNNADDGGEILELDERNIEIKPNVGDGRDVERWLFSDWLNDNKSAGGGGRKKEPALPILKKAKWNSGDNPVLVTAGLMMVGILVASVTERVAH